MCFWDIHLLEPTLHASPKPFLQGPGSIASVHTACWSAKSLLQQPEQQIILFPFLPDCREHTYLPLLLMALENVTSVFLGKSFRALLFSASQGSRNCEIISILWLYVPWSCYTVQSEIDIRPQGIANDAFSLSMAHAHSWGVTELAFIVLIFSLE